MTAAALAPTPFLVVFGRDTAGKPHASWFDQASAELATKAAGLMNMHAVPVESDALRALAGDLPRGRVFSSGRAFTPFVKGQLYSQLVDLTQVGTSEAAQGAPESSAVSKARPALQLVARDDADDTKDPAPTPPAPSATKSVLRPSRADEIGMGSLVLASTGPAEGWWEAEVIGLNGSMLTLRWRDFVEPTVVRRRAEVAFLPAIQG